ncbi:MAG: hypothetical protein QM756_44865 [Polyangiaceae bacterium]
MACRNRFRSVALFVICALGAVSACAGGDGPPGGAPGYQVGALCASDWDCATGYCCKAPPCRGGMCSYACRDDFDCPSGTRCDGGTCFWACAVDANCPIGQTCKKAHTVCQY